MIHVPAARRSAAAERLGALLGLAAREARDARPGSENFLARLAELTFVEAIRQHVESLPETHSNWLAGLRDPVVCRALSALHGAPREPWTVEGLARHVGVSRSVLAERFTEMVGHPPMQYLALWRMQLAATSARRGARRGRGRERGRLRVGGGVQPRLQEAGRPAPGELAPDRAGQIRRAPGLSAPLPVQATVICGSR